MSVKVETSTINVICLQRMLQNSFKILRKYDWLVDSYVLDFYVDDHWSKLPKTWQTHFDNLNPEDLGELLDESGSQVTKAWPLSLLTLKKLLEQLCVKREVQFESLLPRSTITEHTKLKTIFTKCVKSKKQHEIQRMAAICQQSIIETPVDFVVDFGAGLGHLARALGYGYGVKVCCLEMQAVLNDQARIIDMNLEATAKKYLTSDEVLKFRRPVHVTLQLTAAMLAEEFLQTIKNCLQLATNEYSFGIIGLHPCGDLGPVLIKMFLSCKQAKFLNIVGCCYMKLTTSNVNASNQSSLLGYPLSKFLVNRPMSHLSYESREISCHALETYRDRLCTGSYDALKVHSFRAATERILIKRWPELKHCGLRSVKHTTGMIFEDYFYKAVKGLNQPALKLSREVLQLPTTQTDLKQWKRIVIFYTLRLLFAPLIESIVLYDRILFLMENGCDVKINAIFDPRLSPRNHITSAVKS